MYDHVVAIGQSPGMSLSKLNLEKARRAIDLLSSLEGDLQPCSSTSSNCSRNVAAEVKSEKGQHAAPLCVHINNG